VPQPTPPRVRITTVDTTTRPVPPPDVHQIIDAAMFAPPPDDPALPAAAPGVLTGPFSFVSPVNVAAIDSSAPQPERVVQTVPVVVNVPVARP
jgi:hypothetical protein